jgi:hypothetical protein
MPSIHDENARLRARVKDLVDGIWIDGKRYEEVDDPDAVDTFTVRLRRTT